MVDLSQWTLINANSIKEKMELSEKDQASDWRIEPCGWDRDDRTYFVLDDNRLYRRSDPPVETLNPPKPKNSTKTTESKSTKAKLKSRPPPTRGTRASKRIKTDHYDRSQEYQEDEEIGEDSDLAVEHETTSGEHLSEEETTFGGMKWECIAITLEEYQEFLSGIVKSRDPNEKALYKFVTTHVIPIIESAEERRRQKFLRQQRELEGLQKLATAKRSSRIADKRQHEMEEAETRAAEEKRQRDLLEAQAMLFRDQQMEQDRESRRLTREQRIKERELRRVLEEEALNNLTAAEAQSENSEGEGRKSKRQLKTKIERKRKAVEELQLEEDWVFDCSGCGVHGANIDDGSHSVACDSCNVWQHSACLGISETAADKVHFVCKDCKVKKDGSNRQKPPPIKLKLNQSSSSPPSAKKAKKERHVNGGSLVPAETGARSNGHSINGTQWHNIFGKSPPPAHGVQASSFIAFDPSKYYTQTDVIDKTSNSINLAGFSPGNLPHQPGQPPIGRFVTHSHKPNAPTSKQTLPPKSLINGVSAGPLKSEATNGLVAAQSILADPDQDASIEMAKFHDPTVIETALSPSKAQHLRPTIDVSASESTSDNSLSQPPTVMAGYSKAIPGTSLVSAVSNDPLTINGPSPTLAPS